MDRLTTTIRIPPEGTFKIYSDEERKELKRIGDVSQKEIYRRLQAYEDSGLSPEEVLVLKAEKEKRDKLLEKSEALMWDSKFNPCPQCGGRHISTRCKRVQLKPKRIYYSYYFGYCHSCGYKGSATQLPSKALEAWNKGNVKDGKNNAAV